MLCFVFKCISCGRGSKNQPSLFMYEKQVPWLVEFFWRPHAQRSSWQACVGGPGGARWSESAWGHWEQQSVLNAEIVGLLNRYRTVISLPLTNSFTNWPASRTAVSKRESQKKKKKGSLEAQWRCEGLFGFLVESRVRIEGLSLPQRLFIHLQIG